MLYNKITDKVVYYCLKNVYIVYNVGKDRKALV